MISRADAVAGRDRSRTATPAGRPRSVGTRAAAAVLTAVMVAAALWVLLTGWGTTPASAFWTADSVRPGTGAAQLVAVERGSTPQPSVDRAAVTLDWQPVTLSDGRPVAGYTVRRYAADGTVRTVGAGCSGRITSPGCTERDVPDGVWTWTVTALWADSWTGAESPRSASTRVDTTAPQLALTRQSVSGSSLLVGDTLYYRGAVAGSFRLLSAVTDTGSGPESASTGQLSGTSTGWTHTPTNVSTPEAGPYPSDPFSWTAGTTSSPGVDVVGFDRAGNLTARSLGLRDDSTGPTGGQLSHSTGALTAASLTVSLGAVQDAGVGVASRVLQRSTATLSGQTCSTFGTWSAVATNPGATVTDPVQSGRCYQYRYVLTDAFGNTTTVAGPGVARVRSYQTTVQGTSGLVGYWRMDDVSGGAIAAANGSNGTYSGGPTRGQAGAVAGDPSTSVLFDGVDDFGRVQRPIGEAAFSIEFWFRSTQGLGTGSTLQWYNGAGLVDAEVGGVTNDFGVSLSADGQVLAGTGSPDLTVRSGTGYNNGQWHHAVLTRSAGTLVLYVDGVQAGRATGGNAAALTAPANIDFGRLQSGVNHYRGNLDEIALYNTALAADVVLQHYQAGRP